ncbi:hypothetical protein RU639_008634 [Aspergillus parasiticus]
MAIFTPSRIPILPISLPIYHPPTSRKKPRYDSNKTGIIEDLFEDDSILATPVDELVLDDKNNCECRLVPNVPPTDDNESWDRYASLQNTSQYTLAATLVQMENLKKNGDDLNKAGDMTGPPLKWVLDEYAPSVVEHFMAGSRFTKNAGVPFSSADNDLGDERATITR